ncbi:MAG: helix-turn-helix domain-containing protein [Alphaproteobacteria bacterium]|nr:helix-turn-helix domain-containing protein [Alphaproteobacteria bacterium]
MLQTPSSPDSAEPGRASEPAAQTRAAVAEAQLGLDPDLRAGEKLARARVHLGLSIDQVSDRLRVRRDYLEALEQMNIKLLPGRAYTLAYLRSYAAHLGLDPAAVVAQFQRESALTREDVNPQLRNPESKPRRERPWLAALAIAAAIAGFMAWRAYEDMSRATRPVRDTQTAEAPAAAEPNAPAAETPLAPPAPTLARVVVELRALQPAWLEVRGPDGTIFFARAMQAGEGYRPDVGAGWTIHTKDGGAFELLVDGVSRGPLGDVGSPVLGRRVDAIAASAPPPVLPPPPAKPKPTASAAPSIPATAAASAPPVSVEPPPAAPDPAASPRPAGR